MIVSIIGARPQFIKAAVLSQELRKNGLNELIIHTGQHYDYKMSSIFFEELGLPGAEYNLNVGSGLHGAQTANILTGIENILIKKIDEVSHVLLYGDTNSTLAGALAAAKLNIPIIHVEAGLRSFNKTMPEEINRVTTDHLSSVLFCSSEEGKRNLMREGICEKVYITGDIMLDAFNIYSEIALDRTNITNILPGEIASDFLLLTIHRPANTDNAINLQEIISSFEEINSNIVWPVHPRNKEVIRKMKIPANLHLFDPFSYFEMMVVLNSCRRVITDSGGLQKEAYWAKKPCITIRPETEWVETLHNNWNVLSHPNRFAIAEALNKKVDPSTWIELYGDGKAASKMVQILKKSFNDGV